MIAIAGAPVSFGVFELSPPGPDSVDGERVAEVLAELGYAGIDLGPVGFLGTGPELRRLLTDHGLALAGGWVDLPFHDTAAVDEAWAGYLAALRVFEDAAAVAPRTPPRPTLACSSTPDRAARPGGGADVRLSAAGWSALAGNVSRAVDAARERGLEPTFHHHACTYVETVDEVDELLDRTDVGLTFDTGHLLLGGGDPVTDLRRWADRVDHVHLKDARTAVLAGVVARGGSLRDVWTGGAFVRFGDGDLDLAGVVGVLGEIGYDGWVVVEQDVIPTPGHGLDAMVDDQRHNREVLRRWFA